MAFQVRYKDTEGGAYTTLTLAPGPTEVDYPPRRDFKVQATQDGAHVVQRPLRDSRPRKWVWKGYGPNLPTYENQWQALLALEYRTRLTNTVWPIVEVQEDVLGESGFSGWVKVKFLRVERTPRGGGGGLVYDDSTIEFVIVDGTFTGF